MHFHAFFCLKGGGILLFVCDKQITVLYCISVLPVGSAFFATTQFHQKPASSTLLVLIKADCFGLINININKNCRIVNELLP